MCKSTLILSFCHQTAILLLVNLLRLLGRVRDNRLGYGLHQLTMRSLLLFIHSLLKSELESVLHDVVIFFQRLSSRRLFPPLSLLLASSAGSVTENIATCRAVPISFRVRLRDHRSGERLCVRSGRIAQHTHTHWRSSNEWKWKRVVEKERGVEEEKMIITMQSIASVGLFSGSDGAEEKAHQSMR